MDLKPETYKGFVIQFSEIQNFHWQHEGDPNKMIRAQVFSEKQKEKRVNLFEFDHKTKELALEVAKHQIDNIIRSLDEFKDFKVPKTHSYWGDDEAKLYYRGESRYPSLFNAIHGTEYPYVAIAWSRKEWWGEVTDY